VSAQSERIRAALVRTDATRLANEPPTPQPTEGPRPPIALSEENLATLLGSGATSSAPPKVEPAEARTEPARPALTPDVETTLPLLAASQENVAALSAPGAASRKPPERELAVAVETTLPLAAVTTEKIQGRSRAILAVFGAAIALAGISAYLGRGHWLAKPIPGGSAAGFPLQVNVEPQGNGLVNIRWNPQSAQVTQAREGRLVITERDQQPRIVTLDPDQLRIGHLFFQSSSDRIQFQLEVVDRSGAITKEAALAVSPGIIAAPPEKAPSPTGHDPGLAIQGPSAPNVDAKAGVPQVAAAVETPQTGRPPLRTFTLPPPSQPSTEAGRVILPDPPAPVASGSVTPPATGLPTALDGIPEPPVKQAAQAPLRTMRVGGNVQAANLIKKVAPVYPPAAKSARIQGAVRFTATIAKNGTIQNLQLVSGQPLLVQAATDAVKQWVYRPLLLNGEPVEVITQIDVNFDLSQ
jgi:TonB family protein